MRASPISGLLSAMMISSEGTQFDLDFLVVQIHDWDFQPAQLIRKPKPVPTREFGCLPQRELPDLEEPDGQLELQFSLHLASRLAARHQQVIWILHGQLSHEPTLPHPSDFPQAHWQIQSGKLDLFDTIGRIGKLHTPMLV